MAASVAILYGFTEGEWHGNKMRLILHGKGYTITNQPLQADILIVHSGGVYELSNIRKNQLVMLINPPFWPGKPLWKRGMSMTVQLLYSLRPGNQPYYHLRKTAHNIWYLVRHAHTNTHMLKRARAFNLAEHIGHSRLILVRNNDDPWLTPDLDHLKNINPKLIIQNLQGEHDDCWQNPEPYINLL